MDTLLGIISHLSLSWVILGVLILAVLCFMFGMLIRVVLLPFSLALTAVKILLAVAKGALLLVSKLLHKNRHLPLEQPEE